MFYFETPFNDLGRCRPPCQNENLEATGRSYTITYPSN